jgi:hypothetical protein
MYKLQPTTWRGKATSILRLSDNAFIPFDPDNTDYQAYLKWLEESPDNIPLPAENT